MSRRQRSSASVSFFAFQDILMGTIGIILLITVILVLLIGSQFIDANEEHQQRRSILDAQQEMKERALEKQQHLAHVLETEVSTDRTQRRFAIRNSIEDYKEDLERTERELDERRQRLAELAEAATLDGRALRALELMEIRDELSESASALRLNPRVTYQLANPGERIPIIVELSRTGVIFTGIDQAEGEKRLDLSNPSHTDAFCTAVLEQILSYADLSRRYLLFVVKPSGIPLFRHLEKRINAHPKLAKMTRGYDLLTENRTISTSFESSTAP